jgi:predicted DNA-binding transcriptional regulator YafY
MASIATINQAIRHKKQIRFKYLSYSFNNLRTQVERRGGKDYVVHPYKLLIDNGFFYVLTYDGNKKKNKVLPYRIDRMRDVRELPESRLWDKEFASEVNMDNYTQRVFSMFGGQRERVTIRFIDQKLDTVVDQFGVTGVKYEKIDDKHFTVQAEVEISDMFYAWVAGFGRRAKIIDPPHVVEGMHEFAKKVYDMYEPR